MAKTKHNKNDKSNTKLIIGAIILLTAVVFSGVTKCDFLTNWDDDGYIIQNTHIYKINFENIGKIFSSYYKSNYQPLSVFTYAIEFALFGLKPQYYHITNLLFHLFNTALVFIFIKNITNKQMVAAIVALFFGIHTMHVESVAWIAERKDVTYAMFYLLALIAYLKYVTDTSNKKQLWITLGWFLASCLSKSMAVTLPVVLLLIDYYKERKLSFNLIIEKWSFFFIALVFGIIALFSQSGQAMDIAPDFGPFNRIFIVSYAVIFYIIKLIVPTGLAAIHYYPPTDQTLPLVYYLSPFIILSIGIAIWKAKTFRNELLFGLGFFLITISLVLQIVPVGHAFASERYSYVPYIGLFFIIAQLYQKTIDVPKFNKFKSLFTIALIIFAILNSYLTFERVKIWENSINLFSDCIKKYPNAAHAYWMRGNVYKEYKQNQLAIQDYTKAIELDPEYAKAYFNRGGAKANLKKYDESIQDYTRSIEIDPDYAAAWNNRGNSYAQLKQINNAINDYQEAIRRDSLFIIPYKGLGDVMVNSKNYDKALMHYEAALKINENYTDAMMGKAIALYNLKKPNEACEWWQNASNLGHAESKKFYNQYCVKK